LQISSAAKLSLGRSQTIYCGISDQLVTDIHVLQKAPLGPFDVATSLHPGTQGAFSFRSPAKLRPALQKRQVGTNSIGSEMVCSAQKVRHDAKRRLTAGLGQLGSSPLVDRMRCEAPKARRSFFLDGPTAAFYPEKKNRDSRCGIRR
jgi:hypothetical protein